MNDSAPFTLIALVFAVISTIAMLVALFFLWRNTKELLAIDRAIFENELKIIELERKRLDLGRGD